MSSNEDLAEYLAGGMFDPDYEYKMKSKELSKDARINKDKFIDVNAAYKELKSWEKSETYRMTNAAKNLLSSFDITNDQLKSAMQRNYNISDSEYNTVLKSLANSKDVEVRRSPFDGVVKLKRKSL